MPGYISTSSSSWISFDLCLSMIALLLLHSLIRVLWLVTIFLGGIKNLLTAEYSEQGSPSEEQTYIYFSDFLDECEGTLSMKLGYLEFFIVTLSQMDLCRVQFQMFAFFFWSFSSSSFRLFTKAKAAVYSSWAIPHIFYLLPYLLYSCSF